MAQKTDNQRTAIEAYNESAMAYRSPYERWKEAE